MTSTAPGKPRCDNPTETSIDVQWDPVEGATGYKIVVREFPKDWSEARIVEVPAGQVSSTLTVDELAPTSTYQVRIVAVTAAGDSEPSPEFTIDTAVGNCVPDKEKKNKCVVS